MLQLLIRMVSSSGALITAASVLGKAQQLSTAAYFGLWAVILVAAYAIAADIILHLRVRPKQFPPKSPGITEFMSSWLSSGGRSAVFSHDMSWVSPGSQVLGILEKKARDGELELFVGRRTPTIQQLAESGAMVFDYSALDFRPRSRFTIVDKDKAGARMAIGLVEKDMHVIRQYGSGDHAIMAIAEDLVRMAERSALRVQ